MTTPPYNPNIPQVENSIGETQKTFQLNFENLFSAFSENHVALDDATNPGNHEVIQLVEQRDSKSTTSEEIIFYTKSVPGQTEQLFMRYPSNGKEFQVTEFQIFTLPAMEGQFRYFSFLPGGIVVYFGAVFPNSYSFTIELSPPICSNIMGINLCPAGTSTISNPLFQSNVAGFEMLNGKVVKLKLNNSSTLTAAPTQFYLIFGNI